MAGMTSNVKMDVPVLLKKLETLNEEGQSLQREIQKTDEALTSIRLKCEMGAQVLLELLLNT